MQDLRVILRVKAGHAGQPTAMTRDSRTLQSTPETGADPAAAAAHGIRLQVVKHTKAKRGFILLPRRWVVERSFAWAARFRRLARDYEHLADTLAAYHYLAFACLMIPHALAAATS